MTSVIIDQMSLKEGLKKWGKKIRGSVHSYMKQIHMRDTCIPIHGKYLTKEHRNTILDSHLLLKEKRDGTQKGTTVRGGKNQI